MGSGTQPQQARRRLDDYGTRTLVVGALGVIGRNVRQWGHCAIDATWRC